jgi:type I restriction enzyme S subunit
MEQVLSAIKGTTFAEITLAALRQLPLAMPTSREEQSMIASRLDLHQEVIRAELRQLAKLRFQKLGLMQDLLTGKVRVPLRELEVTA